MHIFNYYFRVSSSIKCLIAIGVIYLFSVTTSYAQKERIKKQRTNFGMGYLEYLPAGYSNGGSKYPVIIYLHGRGEKGNGSSQIDRVRKWGPLHKIDQGGDMCFTVNGKKQCFIVIGPQTNSSWSSPTVGKLIDFVKNKYNVDPDRIYLTGLSLGGIGTWNYSYSGANENNDLAAIAPVSGIGKQNMVCALADRKIPVWAFHGKSDSKISFQKSKKPIDALKKCASGMSVGLTLYSGVGHNKKMWERAYDDSHKYQSPNMYEWFLKQKKNGGSQESPAPSSKNQSPVAKAGGDKKIKLPTSKVVLNGSNSKDPDGNIKSYKWSKKSGPSAKISNTKKAKTTVSKLKKGTYVFTLKVTDNKGATDYDQVKVVVNKKNSSDKDNNNSNSGGKLVAKAGADQVLQLPDNSFVLDGRKSSVANGKIVSYKWRKIKGSINFHGIQKGKTVKVNNMRPGAYVFELIVVDNHGKKAKDRINVYVNSAPVARAGKDQMITLPSRSITLNGKSSKDKDGKVVKYEWKKIQGSINFHGTQRGAVQKVNNMRPGKYVFELTVTDNKGATDKDRVVVHVNRKPVAKAGNDKTTSSRSITLNGRNSRDNDGKIVRYEWRKLSGSIDFGGIKKGAVQKVNNLRPGKYVFKLTVEDNLGATSSDKIQVYVRKNGKARTTETVAKNAKKQTTEKQTESSAISNAINRNTELKAYPNPVGAHLTVELPAEITGNVAISLINMQGRTFSQLEENVMDGQGKLELDLSGTNIPAGIFFLKVEAEGFEGKVIKLVKY